MDDAQKPRILAVFGLQHGDFVTGLDGAGGVTVRALQQAVERLSRGKTVELELFRDGLPVKLTIQTN